MLLLAACAAPAPPPLPVPVVAERPACPPPPPPPAPPPVAAPAAAPDDDTALLAYADRVRVMAPGELAQEIARLAESQAQRRTPLGDLQLATALGLTRSPQDSVRAQALVQRVLAQHSAEAERLQPLARLMQMRFVEQRRLEDQIERQAQQLRESQRRLELAQDRLEAMRAVERSLSSRGAAVPAAPAGTVPR